MQSRAARARRPRGGGGARGGGNAARVQHDRRLGQPDAGHAGDARVAREPRGDRRFGGARRPQPAVRRPDLPRRLRQDRAGAGDGDAPARRSGTDPLLRRDGARHAPRCPGDDPGRVGGGRRARGRADHGRRARRARATRLSRLRHLHGTLHRQHDGSGDRLSRARPDRPRQRSRDRPGQGSRRGRPPGDSSST